jgi:Polysaccharide deacetylase
MSKSRQARVIVRLDDLGRADDESEAFLSRLLRAGLFVSGQIVPAWLDKAGADHLRSLARCGRLELAQHGWSHTNHALSGQRRYEFGPSRGRDEQSRDIRSGIRRLTRFLGSSVAPVFSAPWDRLNVNTLRVLAQEGFRVMTASERVLRGRTIPRGLQAAPVTIHVIRRGSDDVRRLRPAAAVAADIRRSRCCPIVVEFHAKEFASTEKMDEFTAMLLDLHADGFCTGHFCFRPRVNA